MLYRLHCTTNNSVGLEEYLSYSEIDDEGYWSRYLEIRADGTVLRYSTDKEADRFGILPEGLWNEAEAKNEKYGIVTAISVELFEAIWAKTDYDNHRA